jgi:tetratricopeptide (TPR) repeat protein
VESLLDIYIETREDLPGSFWLRCNGIGYPVEFHGTQVVLYDLFRRVQAVFNGGVDPSGLLSPFDLFREVGIRLWQILISHQEHPTIVPLLRLDTSPIGLSLPPALAAFPWELLYDPNHTDDTGFLARQRPILRLAPPGKDLAPIQLPLRVLLLLSSPPDLEEYSRVDVESERAAVEHALQMGRQNGLVYLLVEDTVTEERVNQALSTFQPHILHYIGHGEYNDIQGGSLLWEDAAGRSRPIAAERVAGLLQGHTLHAVVLHGCQTALGNTHFNVFSLAQTLLTAGIPAVLAQRANFSYAASQCASAVWYDALIRKMTLADGILAVRRALAEADFPEWPVPVLQCSPHALVVPFSGNGLPGETDPLLAPVAIAADLPAPTNHFVGRHRELRELQLMLEAVPGTDPTMALITGPAGIGKTTLVLQAARRSGRQYRAALLLSCKGYQQVDLILLHIAEFLLRLGAPQLLELILPDPKMSVSAKIDASIDAFNQLGPLLLIIDDIEHALTADQMLRDPDIFTFLHDVLMKLHTGRVVLCGRFSPADFPSEAALDMKLLRLSLQELSVYETRQLLARHPGLVHLGGAVRDILVHEFGGLPATYDLLGSLAIEQDLESLVHDAFNRITQEHKRRSAEVWEQVRRQMVEVSALEATLTRLPEVSRTLLRRISVFRQDFPRAALEQGLHASEQEWQPLLDWGLLYYDPFWHMYHLHSIPSQYVTQQLQSEERKAIQFQLAQWYEQYADQESHLLTDYLEAYDLSREASQYRYAGELVLKLAFALRRAGLYQRLWRLCTQVIKENDGSNSLLVARAMYQQGVIAQLQSNYQQAQQRYQESLERFQTLGEVIRTAEVLHQLGMIAQEQENYAQARRHYHDAQRIFEQEQDRIGIAGVLRQLGTIEQELGHVDEAHRLYQESVDLFRQVDDPGGVAEGLHALATLAQEQGENDEAIRLFQEILPIFEEQEDQVGEAALLFQMGVLAQDQGKYEDARHLYLRCLTITEALGDISRRASTLFHLGMLALMQQNYDDASHFYQESLEHFQELGDQSGHASVVQHQGILAQDQGNAEEALRLYQQSLEIFTRLHHLAGQAAAFRQMGELAQERGEYTQARHLYQNSLKLSERLHDPIGQAVTRHQIEIIARQQGNYEEAQQAYQENLVTFERLGHTLGQATSLHQLGLIAHEQGHYQEAQQFYRRSLAYFKRLDDQEGRAVVLHQLGMLAQDQEHGQEAQHYYQESLAIKRRLNNLNGCATTLHQLGTLAQGRGDEKEAQRFYQESLTLFQQTGNQAGYGSTIHQLGILAQSRGEFATARRYYKEGLRIAKKLSDRSGQANALGRLGLLACQQKDLVNGLKDTIQALLILEVLHTPTRTFAWRVAGRIRADMDATRFVHLWRKYAGSLPLPDIYLEPREWLQRHVLEFIQAKDWEESQRLVYTYPDLLQAEADVVLQELLAEQVDDESRAFVELHCRLLRRSREESIDAAFADILKDEDRELDKPEAS